MMQITTHSADETQALGQKLASRLAPGDVIAYFGDLGAGKIDRVALKERYLHAEG